MNDNETKPRLKHVRLKRFLGVFVTAKLKGKEDCRQGWVISANPFIIKGNSGIKYDCEGHPSKVINPPKRKI